MESTPVSGVETKKETVAPLVAPWRLSPSAVGSTPQEQSGNGAPITAPQSTDLTLPVPKKRSMVRAGTTTASTPASAKPNSRKMAASFRIHQICSVTWSRKSIIEILCGRLETALGLQPSSLDRRYCGRYLFSIWQATEYCGSTTLATSIRAAWPSSWLASSL